MSFRLPRLPASQPPWPQFQTWWQRFAEKIEAQEQAQDTTINNIRRLLSHTVPTTILSAKDDGGSCTITVLNHRRIYADGTFIDITGSPTSSLLSDTWYACYYDDITLKNGSPHFQFTIDTQISQAATEAGRHFCGLVKTPVSASGETIESGGAYPVGAATVGGELQEALA